jgi:hypothetical protein
VLLAVLMLGACGGAGTAGEPAVEPAASGATDPPTTDAEPAESGPTAAASPAGPGEPAPTGTPSEPQQAAQLAAPEPEPEVEEPPPPVVPAGPPGDGELRIGRPEIARGSGRINGNLFARAVERKRGGLLTCYNVSLGADPALRGSLVVVLVVDPQGMVGVRVEEDDEALAAAGVTACVVQKLRQVSFSDTPPGSELWVRVPLEFKP